MHVLTFLFTMINVSETQEYTVTCIIYSQSELVFGHVYSVAIDWTHLWVMLLHLLIPCGMTTVNLFISFINSLHADAFCGCMHDTELTLFQALHCSSLASVTACRCWLECNTIGFIMHSLGACRAMVHCTFTPCIYIYINCTYFVAII